jgi:hypothetical protein
VLRRPSSLYPQLFSNLCVEVVDLDETFWTAKVDEELLPNMRKAA